jgi:PIN domain nuclease of toxin-antitoxin system
MPTCREIINAIGAQAFELLSIGLVHLLRLATLPVFHKDPFDHLLIAQAITEQAAFVSNDRCAPDYPVEVITCL